MPAYSVPVAPAHARTPLPTPGQLAALGVVLCLYRPQAGGELAGWSQAVRAEAEIALDSDGMHESLRFYDGDDRCCWRLHLLPDSDFLAWEQLAGRLPLRSDPQAGIGERLLRRLAGNVGGGWSGSILRLHVHRDRPAHGHAPGCVLAASLAPVSALGAAAARRIALGPCADASALSDACWCERAARVAAQATREATWRPIRLPSPHVPEDPLP